MTLKMITPFTVDDSVLISSTVPETPPAVYNGATSYALTDRCSVLTTHNTYNVYESLAIGNVGHTPASSPLWWKLVGVTRGVYNPLTAYVAGDLVITVADHKEYEALVGSTGVTPGTDDTKWLFKGSTNRWKLFDQSPSTVTTVPETMTYTLSFVDFVNSFALFETEAATIQIVITDVIDGVVYDTTFDMAVDDDIDDLYEWLFSPITRKSELFGFDLLPYSSANVAVTFNNPGGNVSCGVLAFGVYYELGAVQLGANVGIIDFSVKAANVFGEMDIVERGYSRKGEFLTWIDNTKLDRIIRLLALHRAIAAIYVGAEEYGSTASYGFYKEINAEIAGLTHSLFSISTEGLV